MRENDPGYFIVSDFKKKSKFEEISVLRSQLSVLQKKIKILILQGSKFWNINDIKYLYKEIDIDKSVGASLFGSKFFLKRDSESLDEIHFEWFEKIKHQRNSAAMMTRFSISITLNLFYFEPLKMDLV